MLGHRRGGSANAEQSAWGPQSEKHISLGGNSDAISEIFPGLFHGGFIFFDDDDAGSLIWDQGSGVLPIVEISLLVTRVNSGAPPEGGAPSFL